VALIPSKSTDIWTIISASSPLLQQPGRPGVTDDSCDTREVPRPFGLRLATNNDCVSS